MGLFVCLIWKKSIQTLYPFLVGLFVFLLLHLIVLYMFFTQRNNLEPEQCGQGGYTRREWGQTQCG